MIDTSVIIAIIAGVVGLLTLAIQTWGAVKVAAIAAGQKDQTAKIEEVHKTVNSAQTAMLDTIKRLTAENSELVGANDQRIKNEALDAARKQGQSDRK